MTWEQMQKRMAALMPCYLAIRIHQATPLCEQLDGAPKCWKFTAQGVEYGFGTSFCDDTHTHQTFTSPEDATRAAFDYAFRARIDTP